MAFNLQGLLTEKTKQYGASEDSSDWLERFIASANYALDDIEYDVGIGTTRIAVINTSVDLDEQKYRRVFSMGIDYYLHLYAEFTIFKMTDLKSAYLKKIAQARRVYRQDQTMYGMRGDMS